MSLREHGGRRERVLRPGTRSDQMDSRLRAGNCRKIETDRERLRDVRDKVGRVYYRVSGPRRKDRVDA